MAVMGLTGLRDSHARESFALTGICAFSFLICVFFFVVVLFFFCFFFLHLSFLGAPYDILSEKQFT